MSNFRAGAKIVGMGAPSIKSIRAAVLRQHVLLSNAGAVAFATLANGALGFVYWWVAARFYEVAAVGLASAAISIIGLIAIAGDFGLSTLLAGESQRRPADAPYLISAAVLTSLMISGLLGLSYVLLLAWYSFAVAGEPVNVTIHVLIAIGAMVQSASVVLDSALVGTLNGDLRLFRNLLFGALKLVLISVPVFVAIAVGLQAPYIVATWAFGQLLATLGLLFIVLLRRHRIFYRPDFSLLRGLFSEALYPKSMRFLYEARRDRYQLAPGVPMFEIVRRERVTYRRSGLPGWTDGILPTLKALEASRVAASASVQAPVQRP